MTLALPIFELIFAFKLSQHNRNYNNIVRNGGLFVQVLILNTLAFMLSFSSIPWVSLFGMFIGISATWLIQLEINKYKEIFDADQQT